MKADTSWSIRSARVEDLDSLRALLQAADLPQAGLEDQFESGFFVAHAGGKLVGGAGVERYGSDGLLRSLVVDPGFRDGGIGAALVERCLTHARVSGLTAVYLLTLTAGHYFPRFGFVAAQRDEAPAPVRASIEFTQTCPSTATCMMLALGPVASRPEESA